MKMGKNNASRTQPKQTDVKNDLVRDFISKKKVDLDFCPSINMHADTFTKPIGIQLFKNPNIQFWYAARTVSAEVLLEKENWKKSLNTSLKSNEKKTGKCLPH